MKQILNILFSSVSLHLLPTLRREVFFISSVVRGSMVHNFAKGKVEEGNSFTHLVVFKKPAKIVLNLASYVNYSKD